MIGKCSRAVIFDWDNTLVDSWEVIRVAINTTMRAMGHKEWSEEETRSRVAHSLKDSFPKLFGDKWTEARDIFYDTYANIHLEYLKPIEGAEAALARIHQSGFYLSVVSNKTGKYLRAEAQALGWDKYFAHLIGASDAIKDKPAADPVWLALQDSGIEAGSKVWFVGDMPIDMECARNSGCVPVLIKNTPPDSKFGECLYFPNLEELAKKLTS